MAPTRQSWQTGTVCWAFFILVCNMDQPKKYLQEHTPGYELTAGTSQFAKCL